MAAKTIFILCAQTLLIQVVVSQVIGSGSTVTGNSVVDNNIYVGNSGLSSGYGLSLGLASSGIANAGFGSAGLISSGISNAGLIGSSIGSAGLIGTGGLNVRSSGPLLVTAISPIGPSGLAIASENAIQGNLLVTGQLPFLSAVAFDGTLPTAGSGVATCGCGSGNVGIVREGLGGPTLGIGSGIGGLYF